MHSLEEKVGSTKGRFGELGWKKRLIEELFTVDGIAGEIRKTTNGINTERKLKNLAPRGRREKLHQGRKAKSWTAIFLIFQTERRQTTEV